MNYIYSILGLGVNYLYPILIIPIVVSTYEMDGFGKYSVALAVFNVVNVFVSYGLDVSLPSAFKEKVSMIYKTVVFIRMIIYAIVFFPALALFHYLNIDVSLDIVIALLLLIGQVISPSYVSLYHHRFQNIFLSGLISKILSSCFVMFGIYYNMSLDFIILCSISWTFLGSCILLYMEKESLFVTKLTFDTNLVMDILKRSFPIFLSNILSLCMTSFVLPLVSKLSDFHTAGLYSIFDKILRGVLSLVDAIYNVMYVKSISNSMYGKVIFKKILLIGHVIIILGGLLFYLYIHESTAIDLSLLGFLVSYEYVEMAFLGFLIVCVCSIGNGAVSTVLYPSGRYRIVNFAVFVSSIVMIVGFYISGRSGIEVTVFYFILLLFVAELLSNLIKIVSAVFEIKT